MWRPIIAKVATLREIEEHYSLVDLWRINAALDAQDDAERRAHEKANKKP